MARGLVLLVLVLAVVEAAKQGNVDFIGEWNFRDLPSISNQIQNFISGKSTTQFLQPVSDKSKTSLRVNRRGGKQFTVIRPNIPSPAPSFSIHGNSQYLTYPKSRNLQIVPRMKARERIFIRSKLESAQTPMAPRPQNLPVVSVPFGHPPQQFRPQQPTPPTQWRLMTGPSHQPAPHTAAKQPPPPTQQARAHITQAPRQGTFPRNQGHVQQSHPQKPFHPPIQQQLYSPSTPPQQFQGQQQHFYSPQFYPAPQTQPPQSAAPRSQFSQPPYHNVPILQNQKPPRQKPKQQQRKNTPPTQGTKPPPHTPPRQAAQQRHYVVPQGQQVTEPHPQYAVPQQFPQPMFYPQPNHQPMYQPPRQPQTASPTTTAARTTTTPPEREAETEIKSRRRRPNKKRKSTKKAKPKFQPMTQPPVPLQPQYLPLQQTLAQLQTQFMSQVQAQPPAQNLPLPQASTQPQAQFLPLPQASAQPQYIPIPQASAQPQTQYPTIPHAQTQFLPIPHAPPQPPTQHIPIPSAPPQHQQHYIPIPLVQQLGKLLQQSQPQQQYIPQFHQPQPPVQTPAHPQCNYWYIDQGVFKWFPCQLPKTGPPPTTRRPVTTPTTTTTTTTTTTPAPTTARPTTPAPTAPVFYNAPTTPVQYTSQQCDYWYIERGVYKWWACTTTPPPTTTRAPMGLFDFLFFGSPTQPPLPALTHNTHTFTHNSPMNMSPLWKPSPMKFDITYKEVEKAK